MGAIVTVLIFIVCILLIGVVLIQNSKGGGLSSSFGSGNQVMGVRKTADFLEKATWTLAIALLVLSLASAAISGGVGPVEENKGSELRDLVNSSAVPSGMEQIAPVQQQPEEE